MYVREGRLIHAMIHAHEDSMVVSTCSSLMECLLTCYLPVPWITRGDNPSCFMESFQLIFKFPNKQ